MNACHLLADPPESAVIIDPPTQVFPFNSSAVLTCEARSNPSPSIRWVLGDRVLHSSLEVDADSMGARAILRVSGGSN